MHTIAVWMEQHRHLIDNALVERLPVSRLPGAERLNDAVYYALFPGGKRMRPLLVLLAAGVCGGTSEEALEAAAAIEFLHSASLVVDDLPAMDDAGTRRGHATVHREFGENMALLAALALMNQAYGLLARYPSLLPLAVQEIGAGGMIGGQAADLTGACEQSRFEKTSALARLTLAAGAAAAGANASDTEVLICFGSAIGEMYQICDDMVDNLATVASSGKTVRQDWRHSRWNSATCLGYENSCARVHELVDRSVGMLRDHFGETRHVELLREFALGIASRGLTGSL